MTASLPMYDTARTRAANDRLWHLIKRTYAAGPETLDRHSDPHATWEDPKLVLSQTCGLPFRTGLHSRVCLVGTPDYGVEGCPPGYYRSHILVRRADPRHSLAEFEGAQLARNDRRSQSGWAAIEEHLAEGGFGFSFAGRTRDTGSHLNATRAVSEGAADLAAIDAVTWRLIQHEEAAALDLRILVSTRPTPGLPFITALGRDPQPLFTAIKTAIAGLDPADRATLLLKDIVQIPAAAYLDQPLPPPETPSTAKKYAG